MTKTVAGVTTNYLVDTNNPTGYAQVVDEIQDGAVVKSFTIAMNGLASELSEAASASTNTMATARCGS